MKLCLCPKASPLKVDGNIIQNITRLRFKKIKNFAYSLGIGWTFG